MRFSFRPLISILGLPTVFSFIARFGFYRGLEFRRVAAKCDRDPRLLRSWETHYRARASREFRHDNRPDGRVFLAFAEMLATTHDTLIRKRKARRAIATQQNRKIERRLKELARERAAS
jgi:hypothetical protein